MKTTAQRSLTRTRPTRGSGPSLPRAAKSSRRLSAFNPVLPVDDSFIVAGELRDQFNGLNTLIQQRATPAEVNAAMNQAISTAVGSALGSSSNNSNGVSTLSISASPYYDPGQMQLVLDKLDELINALRR